MRLCSPNPGLRDLPGQAPLPVHISKTVHTIVDSDIIGIGKRVCERFGSFTVGVTPEAINEIYPNAQRSITCGVLERFSINKSHSSRPSGVACRGTINSSIDSHDRLFWIS